MERNQHAGRCQVCCEWIDAECGLREPPAQRGGKWSITCQGCMTPAQKAEFLREAPPPSGEIRRSKYNLATRAACPARPCMEHLDLRTGLRRCVSDRCPMTAAHFVPNADAA